MTDTYLKIPMERSGHRDLLVHLVCLVSRHLRIHRDMKTLAELPDYLLDDMGLTRTDIPAAVRGRKARR